MANWRRQFRAAAYLLVILLVVATATGLAWSLAMSRGLRATRERLLRIATNTEMQFALRAETDHRLVSTMRGPVASLASVFSQAGIHSASPVRDVDGKIVAITYECGRADNHFGLVVTSTNSAIPNGSTWPTRRQIADRIWYYDELVLPLER